MNINSNEILLLNKKIKFAGEAGKPAADVTIPAPETNTPQTGLNALMFQGLNNVVSDPQLAGQIKFMQETTAENAENKAANEYVAPYKSNLAFQGKASKFKSLALAALMGLATLGATSTLTSCDDKEYIPVPGSNTTNVVVNVDLTAIEAMFAQMQLMWQQMLEQQQITNEQLQQNNQFMQQLIALFQQGMLDANEFYAKMYEFMMSSTANQEIIIDMLTQNGMSQEEANDLLRELIEEVKAGNLSAAEAWEKIVDLLGDIKGLLSQAISDFNKFYEEMLAKQDELIATNKQGFEQLIAQGEITNSTLEEMKAQNEVLIELSNKQIEAQNEIKQAIEKANVDSNANFDKVVETLNINKNELIAVLEKMGYSYEEIIKMTASQIINAIDNNTAVTEGTNNLLAVITEQLTSVLPELVEQGKITNEQLNDLKQQMQDLMNEVQNGNISADEFYNKAFHYMVGSNINQQVIIAQLVKNGKTQQEANNLIKQLISDVQSGNKTAEEAFNEIKELLGNIDETLGEISQILKDLYSAFMSYYNDYKNDKDTEFKLLGKLYKNGKVQTAILASMNETTKNMAENINGIKTNTEQLLEIAQDDTKHQELIEAIKNIQAGGVVNIDYQKLEDMFKLMGLTISDAINMSSSELEQAIKDFQNTYLVTEEEQLQNLQDLINEVKSGNISAKDFYRKAFHYMIGSTENQHMIIAQLIKNGKTEQEANKLLNQLISDVQSGNITAEEAFNEIQEILGNIDATLDEINATLKELLSGFMSYYNDYKTDKDAEFKLLGKLYQNGRLQTSILASMNETTKSMSENIQGIKDNTNELLNIAKDDSKHQELIEAIKNIQAGGTTEIDYQRLEDMFKLMGLTISDVIKMSSSQLEQAIKDFQNTYVNVEQKQLEELQTIQTKIDDLQIFLSNNDNNKEIIDAINNITVAIGNGNEDVTNELKNLTEQLNKLQQAIEAIYKAIGEQAAITNTYLEKYDTKFDAILGMLGSIDSKLNTIIANQKTAEIYLDNLLKAVAELKEEIQKLQNEAGDGGSSITLDQLEELWKQHDEANFNKYKELIENLDINVDVNTTTIEELLKSIDAKMEYINDNSEILNQILDMLKGIDWSDPDYSSKLDRIIEILENFKCNCECGGNNEGILGDLEEVLG